MNEIIQAFKKDLARYLNEEIGADLEAIIVKAASNFAEWGRDAAADERKAPSTSFFSSLSRIAFAEVPEMAPSVETFFRNCYENGYNSTSLP